MALLSTSVDYTDKDFAALRVRAYKLVASVFPEWTDENIANFGNMLVELFCFMGDVLTFYQDNQALETRIVTATQRKSLLSLCKLLGYAPPGAAAATVDVTLSIPNAMPGDVTVAAGTFVSTPDVAGSVKFQLLAQAVIPAGSTNVSTTVENSANAQDAFVSTGLANQEFVLTSTPYLDNSLAITDANGVWVQKDNFLASAGTDRHFTVVVDQNDRARVRFGNGVNGAIPSGTINAYYKTGGGAEGNVEPTTISQIQGVFTDAFATPVTISVTNPLKASGGIDRTTNAQIKQLGPASVRAPTNSVAREDFVINARRLPSVARALMLTSNQDASVPENTGFLYVVPAGGGASSQALLDAVKTQVTTTYPCTITFNVIVRDTVYKQIDVSVIAYKRAGYTGAQMGLDVRTALVSFFSLQNADGSDNTRVDYGANYLNADGASEPALAWSDIFDSIRDLSSVRRVDPGAFGLTLNGARADVTLLPKEFPQLGNVTVIDGDTGLPV